MKLDPTMITSSVGHVKRHDGADFMSGTHDLRTYNIQHLFARGVWDMKQMVLYTMRRGA